jgi:hypothetical protein
MDDLDNLRRAERLGVLEVVTLIFSVYVLVALLIQATVRLSPETAEVMKTAFSEGLRPARIELTTFGSGGQRSIQLSYGRA